MCCCNSYNQYICSVATLKMNEAHLKAPSACALLVSFRKWSPTFGGQSLKDFWMAWFLDSIYASGLGPTMWRKTVVRRHFEMQQPKSRFKSSLSYLGSYSWHYRTSILRTHGISMELACNYRNRIDMTTILTLVFNRKFVSNLLSYGVCNGIQKISNIYLYHKKYRILYSLLLSNPWCFYIRWNTPLESQ